MAEFTKSTRVWAFRSTWWLPEALVKISTPSSPISIWGLSKQKAEKNSAGNTMLWILQVSFKTLTNKNISVIASFLHVLAQTRVGLSKPSVFLALPDSSVKDQQWLQRAEGLLLILFKMKFCLIYRSLGLKERENTSILVWKGNLEILLQHQSSHFPSLSKSRSKQNHKKEKTFTAFFFFKC